MKKIIISVLVITYCTMFLCCCGNNSASRISIEHSEEILHYFEEKDSENLKNMFCPYIKNTHNLDDEINKAFELFDGKIVDNGSLCGIGVAGLAVDDGKVTKQRICPYFVNIKSDTDAKYEIMFNEYLINEKDVDYVGVTQIMLTYNDNEHFIIGEVIPD